MTREEAIEILLTADFPEYYTIGEVKQVLNMAIQSLTAISELSQSLKAVNRYEMDEKVLIGFNMAVAIFNKCFGEESCALKNEQSEQNVGICQQNVGEMSEQTDVAVDPYDMKYIRGGKPSYNSIKTELNGDLISRDYVLSKFKEYCDRCGKYKENNGVMCRCCALDDAIDYVEDAPSAEKTTLCTEKITITDTGLISRTDLLNKIWQKEYGKDYDGVNLLSIPNIDIIENMPSAEKTAKWIIDKHNRIAQCSNCGLISPYDYGNYCKWCGARMEGME